MSNKLHEVPYSSQEARSRAEMAIDEGRSSVNDRVAGHNTYVVTSPIDEILFNVGHSREKLRVEIEAAHALLPDAAVPRRKGETDERSIAQRLRLFLDLIDRRVTELLEANNREVERRREVENEPCLIWSNERRAWWRPARCGYTIYTSAAGLYSKEEALLIIHGGRGGWNSPDTPEPREIAVSLSCIPTKLRPTTERKRS